MPHPTAGSPNRDTSIGCRAHPDRSSRGAGRALLLTLALTSAACSDVTGVEEIRTEMFAPPMYQALWENVEACSGHTGDFEHLRWYWTRSFPDEAAAKGQWNARHEITLALSAVENRGVVAHEILHELLDGDPTHEDPAWNTCGIPKGDG